MRFFRRRRWRRGWGFWIVAGAGWFGTGGTADVHHLGDRVSKDSPLTDARNKEARREDHKGWCECIDRALPNEEYVTERGRVGE